MVSMVILAVMVSKVLLAVTGFNDVSINLHVNCIVAVC
jgi:hypothetical protein